VATERILEDSLAIQMMIQRLYLANHKVTLAYREGREEFQILNCEADKFSTAMAPQQFAEWGLAKGEKLSMNLEDRGFKYEAVVHCEGSGEVEGLKCCVLATPRLLRRSDGHRLADFIPEAAPVCTFSNSRGSLLDAQVKGFGLEGLELSFKDSRQNIHEALRMGEESIVEVPLEDNLRMMAPAKVAYFGDTYVGLKFTENADQALLGQYRNWLENQQKLQVQRDRETFVAGENRRAARLSKGPDLPPLHVWVDRDPAILFLSEKEDAARRLAEGLGRKFGILSLDYITGKLRPFLKAHGGEEAGWGRVRLIVIHNHLRLASPLELCRQIVEQEACPLPVVLAGTEEDVDLKRNRALAAGAVDYLPIEPFKILTVLRKLDETLKMFEG
jgi:CheY-like chemotaxis protein